jgi:hypothetical protein
VVSWDHGCGAHSETGIVRSAADWPANDPVVDDARIELFALANPEDSE